ncbi:MAG: BtpA/SgcQ family protein [Anaerolineaceae bacterium]|nr:BtpA/SgcQ family protein [Anaerolineaceae bacterium]
MKYPQALVMIQPKPLPGSYLNQGETLAQVLDYVMKEAQMVADFGFDGFILQNMHDGPVHQKARPETIAYMTFMGKWLRESFPKLTLGVLVNWDGVAGLVVADAIGADFVRVEHLYTGVSVAATGLMQGQCIDILETKKRINSRVPVFADVQEVNANYLLPNPKPLAAKETVHSAFADGLFMSGSSAEESLELIKQTKQLLPDTPVFLGGGATGDNVEELLAWYDGVSVATWIKNGNMRNSIDPKRAKQFLEACEKAKKKREKKA